MVLVSFHRVTRRLLGLFTTVLGLVAVFLFLGQVRHIYHQHLKFKRLESYNRYVDDVTNDLVKLETLANRSSLSVDQFLIMLGQPSAQVKQEPGSLNSTSDSADHTDIIR